MASCALGIVVLGALRASDAIEVRVPVDHLWPIVADSRHLTWWGPPVRGVEVLSTRGGVEDVGSQRRVHAEFKGKRGEFREVRRELAPSRRVSWEIVEDSFGVLKVLRNVGAAFDLAPMTPDRTHLRMSFYQDPRGFGHFLHRPLILPDQRLNRLLALVSVKKYAEFTWQNGLRFGSGASAPAPFLLRHA